MYIFNSFCEIVMGFFGQDRAQDESLELLEDMDLFNELQQRH